MAILDHRGNPVKTSDLSKELAAPSLTSVRTIWHDSVASGLTPEQLAMVLVEVDQNDIVNYITLAEEMEERDLHYRSVLSTRKLAVSGLDVVVEAFSDDQADLDIADAVRTMAKDDPFERLVTQSLDAVGKSFSVSEIMWDRSGAQWFPTDYKWRDQRFFTFDQDTRSEVRLIDEKDAALGVQLAPYKFVVHKPQLKMGLPIRAGLARLAVVAYMCKGYTLKDWMAFAEVFGLPLRVGKYSPAATDEQKAALLTAVSSIGTDAACIIPENMVIEFVESTKPTGGEDMFQNLASWLDDQVSEGVLGQTASTRGTPGRLGGDDEQARVREDIREDDAKQLAATLRRDIVKPFVDLNYGPRERGQYPTIRIFTEEGEDLEALSKSLPPFIELGLPVESSVILDKFGLTEPAEGAELLQPGKIPGTENATNESIAADKEAEAKRLEAQLNKPDDEGAEPTGDVDPEDVPADDGAEATLNRATREVIVELMRLVRRGEELTPDQRAMVVAYAMGHRKALAQEDFGETGDAVDAMVAEELADWERVMDPVLQPLLDHAKASANYQQFLDGFEGVLAKMDSTELAERLATTGFEQRGVGDATDDINE